MKKHNKIISVFLLLIILFIGCSNQDYPETKETSDTKTTESTINKETTSEKTQADKTQKTTATSTIKEIESEHLGELVIHFLDVGHGDSILIEHGNYSMLIDGGSQNQSSYNYLQNQHIESLDYVIATHPHEDHIGGLIEIINNIKIDKIIMPNVTHTSETFDNFLTSVAFSEAKVLQPHVGDIYDFGDASFTIVAPISDFYENLNNYSIVLRFNHGDNSFLFTGDIEAISELEIVDSNQDVSADVLKISHHGSDTSNTDQFIQAVAPSHAIISCAKDNSYGYPNLEVLQRLRNNNIDIYRTDLQGSIIVYSDGNIISFNQDPNNDLISSTLPTTETLQATTTKAPPVTETQAISETITDQAATGENITDQAATGENIKEQTTQTVTQTSIIPPTDLATETTTTQLVAPYVGNANTGKFHHSYCSSLDQMNPNNKVPFFDRNIAIEQGYVPCKRCNP
ncbi:MAG: MBL fold metallo-hydrolase [Clostridiaceae bacterium]|nr:MBL fold metallo-hydrolase [Clostridiaceae bacterium]